MTGDAADPVASVVITNHNYRRFVSDAVDSALAQTVPCQVIVVDDGSTDGSVELLQQIEASHPRVVLLAKENGGQASAMNLGWEAAEAPIVFFLDGDDRLLPDAARLVAERLGERPPVAVEPSAVERQAVRCQFRLQWIDDEGRTIDGSFPEPGRRLPTGEFRRQLVRNPDDIAWQPTSGNAFSAAMLSRIMPIPEAGYRISADHYLSNLSPLYGPVAAIEQTLGHYRVHGHNADHRSDFDLDRIRSILIRTDETRRHLLVHGATVGWHDMPADSDGFASLTTAGLRLISHRFADRDDGVGHPFPGDKRPALIGNGVAAAMGRWDFPPAKRMAAAAWVVALGLAPLGLVPAIAARGLTR